jgi:hypothetical protein
MPKKLFAKLIASVAASSAVVVGLFLAGHKHLGGAQVLPSLPQ